jgi:rare lipoprotein A (peptidoglycan hydrolase)
MRGRILLLSLSILCSSCAIVSHPVYVTVPGRVTGLVLDGFRQRGIASYYAEAFHGRTTANGETFDMNAMTCAHLTLPFGTVLRVTNLDNDRSTTVRVNDRGPYVEGRIIDLSKGAARSLDMIEAGTANVLIEVIGSE